MIPQKQIDKIIGLCDEALTNIKEFTEMVEHLEKRIAALEKKDTCTHRHTERNKLVGGEWSDITCVACGMVIIPKKPKEEENAKNEDKTTRPSQ